VTDEDRKKVFGGLSDVMMARNKKNDIAAIKAAKKDVKRMNKI
jgi:hypothetical protein